MRLFCIKILSCFILLNISLGYGQQNQQHISDTIPLIKSDTLVHSNDTIEVISDTITTIMDETTSFADTTQLKQSLVVSDTTTIPLSLESKIFKPNPTKAVIYSAIFPGLGQI